MKITRRQLRQIIKEVITHEISEGVDVEDDDEEEGGGSDTDTDPDTGFTSKEAPDTDDTGDTGIADTGEVNPCSDLSDREIFDMLKEYPLGDIIKYFHIDGTRQKGNSLAMFNPGGMLPGIQTFKKATSASYSMLSLKGFLDLKDDMIKKWEKSEGLSSQESEERWNEILVGDDYLALVDVISWIKNGEAECPLQSG